MATGPIAIVGLAGVRRVNVNRDAGRMERVPATQQASADAMAHHARQDEPMTEAALQSHRALVLSIAAVWKSYLDRQSAALARAMRPWESDAGPSRMWEPYREAAAFAIARLLTEVAHQPFALLCKSSLVPRPREMNRASGSHTVAARESP